MAIPRIGGCVAFVLALVCVARPGMAGRFETFTQKAAAGPKMKAVAATYFGGDGIEEFLAAGALRDGTIVAFGNAWGPSFPSAPAPLVLGRGTHHRRDPYLAQPGDRKPMLREDDPDVAGFICFYDGNLRSLKKVVRFDWGVASISTAVVLADDRGLLIAGRCTESFPAMIRGPVNYEAAPAGKPAASYDYGGATVSGDVFIARLPASGDGILWATVFKSAVIPPSRLWLDYEQNVYADIGGLVRVSPDGQTITHLDVVTQSSSGTKHRTLTASDTSHYLGIDPKDGSFYFGGDRNTHTGYQPWRQPYLYKYDRDGHKVWGIWDWPPSQCARGGDGNGLCADSSAHGMEIAPDGTIVVAAWSSGANSVFTRQPNDLDKSVGWKGFGMDGAGPKGSGPLAYLLRIDPKTQRLIDGSMFQAYVSTKAADKRLRGAPSAVRIEHVQITADGSIAFTGTSAAGLVQTPDAFYKYPEDGSAPGGEFVAVFSKDFRNLLFSSYLPGCENAAVAAVPQGIVVMSRSRGNDGAQKPTASPIVNAIQKEKKGDYDGHLLLLVPPAPVQ
jgi:hypothetical protein